jgi:hypothetical protein
MLGIGEKWPCSRPPRWGRQSCLQAAFRPPSALNRVTQFAHILSGFVSRRHRAAKPEKFASSQGGGLKPACSQDWLPHKRPKPSGERSSLNLSWTSQSMSTKRNDQMACRFQQVVSGVCPRHVFPQNLSAYGRRPTPAAAYSAGESAAAPTSTWPLLSPFSAGASGWM